MRGISTGLANIAMCLAILAGAIADFGTDAILVPVVHASIFEEPIFYVFLIYVIVMILLPGGGKGGGGGGGGGCCGGGGGGC